MALTYSVVSSAAARAAQGYSRDIGMVISGVVDITFDSSYAAAAGGEAVDLSDDLGIASVISLDPMYGAPGLYEYSFSPSGQILKVLEKGYGPIHTGIMIDDDSAASNGTDVLAAPRLAQVDPYLNSENVGNADAQFDVGVAGPSILIDDNAGSPVGVAIYFDEDGSPADRIQCVNVANADIFIPTSRPGVFIKIKDDDDAASNGVAVHFDDNGGTVSERLLFISPTDADGTFQTYGEVNAAVDLSAITQRFRFTGV